MTAYFEIEDDVDDMSHPWIENPNYNGQPIEPDSFTRCIPFRFDGEATVNLDSDSEDDFDFCFGELDIPVASKAFCEVLIEICPNDIQLIPVRLGERSGYFIINVLSHVRCLDESRSTFTKWTSDDKRPDKIGCYRMVIDLVINPSAVANQHMFRVEGWDEVIVVSEKLASKLRSQKFAGFRLKDVASEKQID